LKENKSAAVNAKADASFHHAVFFPITGYLAQISPQWLQIQRQVVFSNNRAQFCYAVLYSLLQVAGGMMG
jgi:hypothetical protein